jgi:hypothetical protein
MLPWWATVHDPALAQFGLKPHELLISAAGCRFIDNSDLTRLQPRMVRFEQIGAANGVYQHRRMFHRPPFEVHAIAMATDLKANHARTKRLVQHLTIGRVVAEICNNESLGIIVAIDRCELASTRAPISSLAGTRGPPEFQLSSGRMVRARR